MSATANYYHDTIEAGMRQPFPAPNTISDIDGHIVDLLEQLQAAYNSRMDMKQRYWRGLPITGGSSIAEIQALETHLDQCIREVKRRDI